MAENVGSIYYEVTADTAKLVQQERQVQQSLARMAASFNLITQAVKVYAAAQSLIKVAQMADDFRLLQARVNVAADSINAGAAAMEALRNISTSTRSALADNVTIFTRLNPALQQMGGNANDTLRIVELLGKAITVSGASAAEKSSAMIQFGQALGSGKLAGDELRSLLENAPYLMKQLADGLGVPIGALKGLGEQGKLTADVVVNALTKAADRINRDFASFPQTLAGALTVAGDALRRMNERMDALSQKSAILTGIAMGLGQAITTVADMLDRMAKSADDTARKNEIQVWSNRTAQTLSYVADAADVTWQTLSVLGRNVAFVFNAVGTEIGGIGAQVAAVLRGDFAGARAIGKAMKEEAAQNRRELDASDARTLASRKTWGAQMRQAWEEGTKSEKQAQDAPMSKLKAPVDPEQARKDAAKRAAAQAYYEGLLADAKTGLERIALEEQKALADNTKRALEDQKNTDIYAKAKTAIIAKFARERALLEEQYAKESAAATIAITTDEQARLELIRAEAFRAADAEVALGVKTFEQGERAKVVAAFVAGQQLIDLADRRARATYDSQVATTRDTETLIRLERTETVRRAELDYARGKITFEEAEAAKTAAARREEDQRRALTRSRADTRVETLQLRANAGGVEDQVTLIRAETERRLQASIEAQQADLANAQLYADQRVAIEQDMQRRILEVRATSSQQAFAATADAFGQLTSALRTETGKQDAIYRAAFIAQKAYAIASSIVAIQAGIAKASDAPWPANLAAMASVVAATASIISTIKGANYGGGRMSGGPVSANTLVRVNEAGRPEMFTAANGAQYMLPTADGNVTSANRVGEAQGQRLVMQVTQHFNISGAPADMRTQQQIATAAARGLQAAAARNN